jgi:hypothetical protein
VYPLEDVAHSASSAQLVDLAGGDLSEQVLDVVGDGSAALQVCVPADDEEVEQGVQLDYGGLATLAD